MIQDDPLVSYPDEDFDVLQAIFEDAMAYEPEPDTREGSLDIDEKELRECTTKNLEKLKAIVQAYNLNS